ncbi:anti-sigma factor domain-containing protein [Effusibacillus lacus]|uniref:RsgI N-terminal anti-sigma domain-containing protein n=1 Tax=Effusibacillus lacus TaxID=1348429 RepID=A0A292YSL9_9BACL|nr:anti-sigma factor domain-containing protein [Effusibacillus lacus]TCS68962.1 anti-sigma factor-like protein [Effusibacillus lacus]GAX91470.1 hypothetical protein EFBL_3139 [Effusibacillus lacus]
MHETKGIIMKVTGSHAIVMTKDRQFLRIPAQAGMRIGQEVDMPASSKKRFAAWNGIGLLVACLALALGVWQMKPLFEPGPVSAYVAIDINPSLELAVDKEKEVLQVVPLNPDGEALVKGLHLKGKSIESAVTDLADEAAKQGFLKQDSEILVTATDAGASRLNIEDLEQQVMTSMRQTLQQSGIAANVGGVLVSQEIRQEAMTVGLSPGKYALYLQAQAREIPVTVEELKNQSVSDVAKQHGKDMKEIMQSMSGSKKLEDLLAELKEKHLKAIQQKQNNGNRQDNKKNRENEKDENKKDDDKKDEDKKDNGKDQSDSRPGWKGREDGKPGSDNGRPRAVIPFKDGDIDGNSGKDSDKEEHKKKNENEQKEGLEEWLKQFFEKRDSKHRQEENKNQDDQDDDR